MADPKTWNKEWHLDDTDWPLIIEIEPVDDHDPYVIATIETRDFGIAGNYHFDEATAKANARLLLAAPRMLRKLREITSRGYLDGEILEILRNVEGKP